MGQFNGPKVKRPSFHDRLARFRSATDCAAAAFGIVVFIPSGPSRIIARVLWLIRLHRIGRVGAFRL